jgi:hypothetical protein
MGRAIVNVSIFTQAVQYFSIFSEHLKLQHQIPLCRIISNLGFSCTVGNDKTSTRNSLSTIINSF